MKFYGNLINRLQENQNHTIEVGTDATQYYYSDRTCYYVTRVIDQKHVFVKPYQVCADHSKAGGMGHQDWLYFKTNREMQEYTNKCVEEGLLPDYCKHPLDDIKENGEIELIYRYGHWCTKQEYWYDVKLEKPRYNKINISFGVRDYYYDWEF